MFLSFFLFIDCTNDLSIQISVMRYDLNYSFFTALTYHVIPHNNWARIVTLTKFIACSGSISQLLPINHFRIFKFGHFSFEVDNMFLPSQSSVQSNTHGINTRVCSFRVHPLRSQSVTSRSRPIRPSEQFDYN